MGTVTNLVGVIEAALLSGEADTEPSPLDVLYSLQDRAEAAEAALAHCKALADYPVTDDPVTAVRNLALRAERAEAEVETAKLELSQEKFMRQAAEAEVARLRDELTDIAEATNVDDPESYRCDDREGCLDYVYAKAVEAMGNSGQDAAGG